ncbi:MAG: ABC transporter permease [Spirochaetes bacterium]|nr:ABC transporter permease [Spirochaetota bacterium]
MISKMLTVAKYSFKMTAANKGFIIITILGPFLILAVSVLPGLLAQSSKGIPENTVIGIVGADTKLLNTLKPAFEQSGIILKAGTDISVLKKRVSGDTLHGALLLPQNYLKADKFTYYSKTGTDIIVTKTLEEILDRVIIAERLKKAGLNPAEISNLTVKPQIVMQKTGEKSSSEKGNSFLSLLLTSLFFVMLLYMTVLLYGQAIGRSVVTDKTSKIVEILLSSARPQDLMFGKILGIGLAGILQYAVWVSMAILLIHIIGPLFSINLPSAISVSIFLFLVLFFILAFFLYASLYAAIGAASDDEQNLGQLSWPLIIFLVIPMVLISALVMNPDSGFSQFLSFFPLTAPIVMFIRVSVNMPPVWQILLSIAIITATITAAVIGGSKIFRVGILMTGKRFKFHEIIKWIRY